MNTIRSSKETLGVHRRIFTAFGGIVVAFALGACSRETPAADMTDPHAIKEYHKEVADMSLADRFYYEYIVATKPPHRWRYRCLGGTAYDAKPPAMAVVDGILHVYPQNPNAPDLLLAPVANEALMQPVGELSEGVLRAHGCEY